MAVNLPAINYLGYSLDLTTVTPFDILGVSQSVKRARRILELGPVDPNNVTTINGVTYKFPKSVFVDDSVRLFQGNYISYTSGSEAATSFKLDAKLGVRYMAFTGSGSASYSVDKSFRRDQQYALFAFNAALFGAGLENYADLLNQSALEDRLNDMAHPFTSAPQTVNEYKSFFASFGSHAIINTSYGMRFQLTVHASNETQESKKNFSANVAFAYNGITFGGQFDSSVGSTVEYKAFARSQQKNLSAQGGDATKALGIMNDPTSYPKYVEWTETAMENPNLMNVSLVELWTLMADARNSNLRKYAQDVQDAFLWIVSHPAVYKTPVTLTIQSDWAEFGLITPSAVIIPDPDNPIPPLLATLNQNKVTWGKERSHQQRRETIKFFILNDGSPIDFYTSHGSDGGSGGRGQAIVLMEGITYVNDKITDNNWNTMWFWQATASSTPAPLNGPRKKLPGPPMRPWAKWNDVLEEYLRNIKRRPRRGVGAEGGEEKEVDDDYEEEREEEAEEEVKEIGCQQDA